MVQGLWLVSTIVILSLYFYILFYQSNKTAEYKNDERWQVIQLKGTRIVTYYYQLIMCLLAIGIFLFLFLDNQIVTISITHLLTIGFYVLLVGQLVEGYAIKYFDTHM